MLSLGTDKKENKFYVGEDATIRAQCKSSLNVHKVKWQRNTAYGFCDIDTTLPKYKETRNEKDCYYQLEIKILNCNKSDGGTYILKLTCQNVAFSSGEIDLNVVEGKRLFTMSYFYSTYNQFESVIFLCKENKFRKLRFGIKTRLYFDSFEISKILENFKQLIEFLLSLTPGYFVQFLSIFQ